MQEIPGIVTSSTAQDNKRRTHTLRPADRLLVLAVLRRDRLNHGLDRLIEAVLGVSFLQVSTATSTLTDEASPAHVFGHVAKLSLQRVSLSVRLVQVAGDEPIACLSHLTTAAAAVRATLVVHDLAADNCPIDHSSLASSALAHLYKWKKETEAHAGKSSQAWLAVNCAPLTPEVAEAISILITDAEQERLGGHSASQFAVSATLSSDDRRATTANVSHNASRNSLDLPSRDTSPGCVCDSANF